ncbi:MAG TPA: ATP-binding cassette domain-containing protein [Bacteroidia bacterium]|nr:ATP-binding cassette domain-containing protein [Bacteroidia bacterium]
MIELRKVSYAFKGSENDETKAISDIDLEIRQGEFIILLGANGSGKTSLLNLIAGTLEPQTGKIMAEGHDITKLKEHKRCKWIARLFQNPLSGTAPDLSLLENFRIASLRTKFKGLKIGTDEKFRRKVREHVSQLGLGLEMKLDQAVGTLSGGQRQAITLSMAVMDDAKILLMDEPTAALDPKTSEIFMSLTSRIIEERKLSCLFITHQLKDALKYGERIIQLEHGKIIRDIQGDKKSKLSLPELFMWFGQ